MFESWEVQVSCFWLLGDIPIDAIDAIDTIGTIGTVVLAGPSGLVGPFGFVGYRHNVWLDAYNP
jgi:hypothetical protein